MLRYYYRFAGSLNHKSCGPWWFEDFTSEHEASAYKRKLILASVEEIQQTTTVQEHETQSVFPPTEATIVYRRNQ